jgi:hypothetical protein
MGFSGDEIAGFKAQAARRRRSQMYFVLLAVPVIVINPFLGWVAIPVGALYLLCFLGFTLRNWRCPACDGFLGWSSYQPACKRCGAPLM